MTPAGGRGQVRRPARTATPRSPRSWGRPPTTCPACPGVGAGLRRQVDQPVRRPRQRHHPRRRDHRQEGRGAARAPRRRDPQPAPQRAWSATSTSSSRPADLVLAAVGPPGGAHALRRPGVPGAARPALRDARPPRRRSTTRASTWPTVGPRRRRAGRRGWPSTPPAGDRVGVHVARPLGRRHRRGRASLALATTDGTAAWIAADDLDARRQTRARRLAGRPGPAQGAARRQGPDARARRPGLAAGRPGPRHRARRPTSPGPTSAPTTSPT